MDTNLISRELVVELTEEDMIENCRVTTTKQDWDENHLEIKLRANKQKAVVTYDYKEEALQILFLCGPSNLQTILERKDLFPWFTTVEREY